MKKKCTAMHTPPYKTNKKSKLPSHAHTPAQHSTNQKYLYKQHTKEKVIQKKNIYCYASKHPFPKYVSLVFFFFCKVVVFAQVLKGNKVGRSACSAPCLIGTPGKMAKPNGKMKSSHMPTHLCIIVSIRWEAIIIF